MLRELKIKALAANLQLKSHGLDSFGYGNVSVIDRESGLVVARPVCSDYDKLSVDDMLLIDLMGNIVEGKGAPSDDVKIHLELYRNFAELEALAFIRPPFVTAFSQAGRDIPFYGAMHADFFGGDIPCTRELDEHDYDEDYEKNLADSVVEEIAPYSPDVMPAVLMRSHGAIVFGKNVEEVIVKAVALEQTAKTAFLTESLAKDGKQPSYTLLEKRFYSRRGLMDKSDD
ncbi:MAG: class II aldolase/adducin family protein [Candidatus Neoclostridium sp.]